MGSRVDVDLIKFKRNFSFNSFWDANIKSILLTDTCYQRDPLFSCQSSFNCDNYLKAKWDDKLGFMYNTVMAAKNLTKVLVCSDTGNELIKAILCDNCMIIIMNTALSNRIGINRKFDYFELSAFNQSMY